MEIQTVFYLLVFLLGAAHMLSPDHWMPVSIQAWQKSWSSKFTSSVSALVVSFHVLSGFILFFIFQKLFFLLNSNGLIYFTIAWIAVFTFVRSWRFSQLQMILWGAPKLSSKIFTLFAFIGPAESLIPVLIKSHMLPANILPTFFCFWLGSLASGVPLMIFGQLWTDRPMALPQEMVWAQKKLIAIPTALATAVGLIVLFQIQ
jgi:hypothetical protein